MRQVVLAVLGLAAAGALLAQSGRTYSSPGGFGNILYPGTGHAPNAPTGTPGGIVSRSAVGNYYGNRGSYPYYAPRVNHPGHGRSNVVPYPVIVGSYGGYGYGGGGYFDGLPQAPQGYQESAPPIINTNTAPSVVINQTFIPDRPLPAARDYADGPDGPQEQQSGMRVYEGLKTQRQPDPSARRASDQPTLYLLAFKDHRIIPALGYWVEQGNLHYVSAEHSLNQASLDLIDREMSQQLNDERNVEFKLPRVQ